jgi:hypothetical protein
MGLLGNLQNRSNHVVYRHTAGAHSVRVLLHYTETCPDGDCATYNATRRCGFEEREQAGGRVDGDCKTDERLIARWSAKQH